MKTRICDICGSIDPEVKAKATGVVPSAKSLWGVITKRYDICGDCWSKILNHIKPLDKNARRKDRKLVKAAPKKAGNGRKKNA